MAPYEIIEHTADIGIRASGATLEELFQNAAIGMFSMITDLDRIEDTQALTVKVEAEDREMLLVEWLNELLYHFDSQDMLFNRFIITRLSETGLKAVAYGEPIDHAKHDLKTDVKAATYHMLKIRNVGGVLSAEVIFDV